MACSLKARKSLKQENTELPIAPRRHAEEPGTYYIHAGNPNFTGTRLETDFLGGRAITADREKAIVFDEQFGYEVVIHEDSEPWALATDPDAVKKPRQWKKERLSYKLADSDSEGMKRRMTAVDEDSK